MPFTVHLYRCGNKGIFLGIAFNLVIFLISDNIACMTRSDKTLFMIGICPLCGDYLYLGYMLSTLLISMRLGIFCHVFLKTVILLIRSFVTVICDNLTIKFIDSLVTLSYDIARLLLEPSFFINPVGYRNRFYIPVCK